MSEVSKSLVMIGTVFGPKKEEPDLLAEEKMEFLILTWLKDERLIQGR